MDKRCVLGRNRHTALDSQTHHIQTTGELCECERDLSPMPFAVSHRTTDSLHIQQGPRCVCVIVVGVDGMGLCAVESQELDEHVGDGGPLWSSQNNHDIDGQIHGM